MSASSRFGSGTVIEKTCWHDDLFSLKVAADIEPFLAGQFTSLGLQIGSEHVARAYSIASAPDDRHLEFYFNRVPTGPLSPKLCALNEGDTVEVARRAAGFFVLEEISHGKDLWMLATGTGLGPYLSILRSNDVWQRFERIMVVHAVSHSHDLGYRNTLEELAKQQAQLKYIPVVTQEEQATPLKQRFPILIETRALEKLADCELTQDGSRIMLCGSLEMIHDTTAALKERSLSKHRRSKPGQIISEKYW